MPPRESRRVDCVLRIGSSRRIVEVDEKQHFNRYRAASLRLYPRSIRVAFNRELWIKESEKKTKLGGGGWGSPSPPLFPADGGRHQQRAFRDARCDILPPDHGFLATLRIADFEVKNWFAADDASERMAQLLTARTLLN
jgi:very-short-patch-repair endonuclease